MTCQTFIDFVEAVVLPARAANPTHRRLDGQHTGGNWDVAGEFHHRGRRWRVHGDSHFEPLLVAYEAAKTGVDPFVERPTKTGLSLDLTAEFRARRAEPRFKYLYVYEVTSP